MKLTLSNDASGTSVSRRRESQDWFFNTIAIIGLLLMLAGVSYLMMVLMGMGWDWGRFVAAVMLFLIGLLGVAMGVDA